MDLPSSVTILWSMIAAGVLVLGLIHGARWSLERGARADLAFAILAMSFVGVAFAELNMLFAPTAEAWGEWVRWIHLPLFGLVVGTAVFVHLHLGTGRRWLLWSLIAVRAAILGLNFWLDPNFNFSEIASIHRVLFLGEPVSIVGEAVPGKLQFLGLLGSILLAAFVLDATVTLWRRGGPDDRRRAVLVGGSILVFVMLAVVYVQLVIWQLVHLPFLITPSFLVALLAMSFDLSRDMLGASRLAGEVHEGHRRLELAAAAANLGLWEWDGNSNRIWATRRAREIFGLDDGPSSDYRRWLERVHPDDSERLVSEIRGALQRNEEYAAEFRIDPAGQAQRWVAVRGRAEHVGPDGPVRVRGVMRDVSELKRVEDETHELRRELAHAGRVSMLGQLSSSLAHELSQPLGAILRNAEAAGMMLQSGLPDIEELKAIVADIQRDDRRARDVIDRLRAMLKRREADIQPVAADSLIQDVMALVRADAATRGIALEHGASPNLPLITGDRVQLSQVLLNLVLNAMEAVAGQPPDRRRILLAARQAADGQVEIRVTDSGPGIPADLAKKIFEPFYSTKTAGMGMGLAISRTIVESHGGSLAVDSDGGAGATFRVCLPVRGKA
jgi:signal transduction histidine kinase